ncbi:terminase large subunit [Kaistia geumhonensis]|uniref:Phage terminase large subunit-like protein n=1 Tax=Kaistia geumhonensis TaxID=410839 RepID=A0ABU0M5U0_9HYPH|nr:terminase TerL endonuclease subunit [Kaistia geumhonensis]MCX5478462.1 terminase large subunit [Kaistia geumhonensis]MDQ0516320.1 phage terminase large subunit-like protein [Kaistia geumhonensis]
MSEDPLAGASTVAVEAAARASLWPEPQWLTELCAEPGNEWARKAWEKARQVPGAWFDHAKAEKVVALWPTWFVLTDDRFAGVPFRLLPWQAAVVRLLVGWKAPTEIIDPWTGAKTFAHVRVFKRLLLWIPRKNGKSEFLAALALLFFAIEGVAGGQGFVFARDEAQGRVVLRKMKAMIAGNPRLAEDAQPFAKSIYLKPTASLFELLTGSEEGKHGKSPTVIAGDEMHEWRSREVETTLRQGTGTRLQPIELYASTAGKKTNPTGVALWEESLAILDGRIDDPATLVVVFAAGPEDDWRDEDAWRRANPSLGLSPTIAFLRREAALAIDNPRAEAHFRCYHLNQWVDGTVRWLSVKKWDACAVDATSWKTAAQRLKGRTCWGAIDVSSTRDVTALIWLFPPEGDETKWQLACRFWVPELTLAERVKADRLPYDRWKAMGAMETTPGDYVDQNFVKAAVLEGFNDFDVLGVGYDPWNATKLVADLETEGVEIDRLIEMRQGIATLGEPSKHFERLVYAELLDHGGHPVMRWMAGNAVVRFDENLNFAPAKKRSAEKIDGIVAGVMAAGLAFRNDDAKSFWETT